tara:strand:- start:187 stop:348 length:162 start_codon:yes stop_codon:yes gene_type:complete
MQLLPDQPAILQNLLVYPHNRDPASKKHAAIIVQSAASPSLARVATLIGDIDH